MALVVQRDGGDGDHDFAAVGELDRVGQQVDQDLAQARDVADQRGGHAVVDEVGEVDVLLAGFGADQVHRLFQAAAQVEGIVLDFQLADLDFRVVEDVVDDGQQSFAAGAHGLGVIALFVVDAGVEQQAGHADHGIQRRPDFVAHVGEEHALGLHRRLGPFLGRFQLALMRDARSDVAQDYGEDHRALGLQFRDRCLGRKLSAVAAHAADRAALAHFAGDVGRAAKLLDQLAVSRADAWRQQQVYGLSQGLVARPAENHLGAVVEQDDALLAVEADHGIVGNAQDPLQLGGGEIGGGRLVGQERLLSWRGRAGNARPRRCVLRTAVRRRADRPDRQSCAPP